MNNNTNNNFIMQNLNQQKNDNDRKIDNEDNDKIIEFLIKSIFTPRNINYFPSLQCLLHIPELNDYFISKYSKESKKLDKINLK